MEPIRIIALYGSPRRKGNTAALVRHAIKGAKAEGAEVIEIYLRDLKVSPCLEIYGCKKKGRCSINDQFHTTLNLVLNSHGLIVASPIFFYTVSAHLKIFMDRCQCLWVKKFWLKEAILNPLPFQKPCLFISVGATSGKKLFDGILLTMKYFLQVLDAKLSDTLLLRGLDHEADIFNHPEYLKEARMKGARFVKTIREKWNSLLPQDE